MNHFYSKITFLLFFLNSILFGQYINVNTSLTKEELIDKFIGSSSSCLTVSNINISGYNRAEDEISYGYFTKGTSSFELNDGIILSTGKAKTAQGPNNNLQDFWGANWRGDQDLIDILDASNLPSDNILNATYLEFDFVSNQSEQISFEYMFLSEEYQRDNCKYSDAFAFLIKKVDNSEPYKNIALIPGTNTPVTSLTINGADRCRKNFEYFGGFNSSQSPTNFNGQTKLLKAIANVEAGVKYHIKLVIADHGDYQGRYDSAVFLKAGSFEGSISLGNDIYLCPGNSEIIDATQLDATSYKWYKDGEEILGETNPKLLVNNAGHYEVEITQHSSCTLKGLIRVFEQITPTIAENFFSICDDDFDNIITVDLDYYTERIVEDYYDIHQIKYFENFSDAQANTNEIYQITFNSTETTKTVYIRDQVGICMPVIEQITFSKRRLSTANSIAPFDICDDNLDNQQEINLNDYLTELNSSIIISSFYHSVADAKNARDSIPSTQIINADKTFWVRFREADACENVAPISFIFKQPKRSETLTNQTICKNTTTTLDAGIDFDSYLWLHNNSTAQILNNVSPGTYQVKLDFNGCFYTQEVKVLEAEDPIIQSINIQGSTVTVNVTGSTPPYLYSLDNGSFQSSNIFTNVTLGTHTISVKSAVNCSPVTKEFSLIKLINFITPNGDGKNDVLDYSQLKSKVNPKFIIYNREGKLIFEGSEANDFIWDGTYNAFKLPTDSYWYKVEWIEPGSTQITTMTDAILLKNK